MGYLKSVRDLGRVLGVGKSKAAELAKEPWLAGLRRKEGWDEGEVRSAIAARELRDPEAAVVARGGDLEVLNAGDDPLAVAHAAMKVASQLLAAADVKRAPSALESVKRSIEEFRRMQDGALEFAIKKGALIERDVAKAVIGQLGRRAIAVLERYEVQLGSKVEAWLGDPAFRALSSEERVRAVRSWAADQTHALRNLEADDVEKLVATEVKEQAS